MNPAGKKRCRNPVLPKRKKHSVSRPAALLVVTLLVVAFFCTYTLLPRKGRFGFRKTTTGKATPTHLNQLLSLSPSELSLVDIALINTLCAEGMPGAENLDIDEMLRTLDRWALHVDSETQGNLHRFEKNPADYNNSEAYFRILLMVTVLQEDFGVHYNPARISSPDQPEPDSEFFADSNDLFLHGIASPRRTGTCISLPVLYVAIGRRLGYPLKLVTAKEHLFARWDDPGRNERFNIEATSRGLNTYEDSFYKGWPFPLSESELSSGAYLKSLTPCEELSIFLQTRGHCARVAGLFADARFSYERARLLAPNRPENQILPGLVGDLTAPKAVRHRPDDVSPEEINAINEHNRQMVMARGQSGGSDAKAEPLHTPAPLRAP